MNESLETKLRELFYPEAEINLKSECEKLKRYFHEKEKERELINTQEKLAKRHHEALSNLPRCASKYPDMARVYYDDRHKNNYRGDLMFGQRDEAINGASQLILTGRPLAPWERLRVFELMKIIQGERKIEIYRWNVRDYQIVWSFIAMTMPHFVANLPGGKSLTIKEAISKLSDVHGLTTGSIKIVLKKELRKQFVRTKWVIDNAKKESLVEPEMILHS